MHSRTFTQAATLGTRVAQWAGELCGRFINSFYAPILYITPAIYSGWFNRTAVDGAAATNTILACENPVSLDYISARDVISKVGSPPPTWLDPTWFDPNIQDYHNTHYQLLGCNSQGIGTLDPAQIEIVTYDFAHPTATRLDIDRKIRDFKAGKATEQDIKDVINLYMSSSS